MKIFTCIKHKAVVSAYNRGHACTILGKALKALKERGELLLKSDEIVEFDYSGKKGSVRFLEKKDD